METKTWYGNQTDANVEGRNVLQGRLAVRPVFLKSAHRAETYRAACEYDAPTKERRTTTRTILSEFAVFVVLVTHSARGRIVQPLQPNATQRALLRRLGLATPAQMVGCVKRTMCGRGGGPRPCPLGPRNGAFRAPYAYASAVGATRASCCAGANAPAV